MKYIKTIFSIIINKYTIIITLFSYIFTFILCLITLNNSYYDLSKKYYYVSIFQIVLIINNVFSIFFCGYMSINKIDDIKIILFSNIKIEKMFKEKIIYYFVKNIIILIFFIVNVIITLLIVALSGYIKIGYIHIDLYSMFESLLISFLFYALLSSIIVTIFDIYNLIYIVIVLFMFSLTNKLTYLIVSIKEYYLCKSVYYYVFIIIILYFVLLITSVKRE